MLALLCFCVAAVFRWIKIYIKPACLLSACIAQRVKVAEQIIALHCGRFVVGKEKNTEAARSVRVEWGRPNELQLVNVSDAKQVSRLSHVNLASAADVALSRDVSCTYFDVQKDDSCQGGRVAAQAGLRSSAPRPCCSWAEVQHPTDLQRNAIFMSWAILLERKRG